MALTLAGAPGCGGSVTADGGTTPDATPDAGIADVNPCVSRLDGCRCRHACVFAREAAAPCPTECEFTDPALECAVVEDRCDARGCQADAECGAGFVCEPRDDRDAASTKVCTTAPPSSYVIITDLASDDPYRQAADDLAALRGAETLVFDPADMDALRDDLAARRPRFVAWVTKPGAVDHNFVQRLVQTLASLDADPFLDVSWGIITGRTAQSARDVVSRTALAESSAFSQWATWAEVGPYCVPSNPFVGLQDLLATAGLPHPYAEYDENLSPEAWAAAKSGELAKLTESRMISALGHGYPCGMLGVEAADFSGMNLFPATVVTGACYTASISVVWSDLMRFGRSCAVTGYTGEHKTRRSEIDPANAVALAMLDAGAVAFIGNMNTSGFVLAEPVIDRIYFEAAPLGDAVRALADAVMTRDRHPRYESWVVGQPPPDHASTFGISAGGFILLGDPAFRPYLAPPLDPPVTREVRPGPDGEVSFLARWTRVLDLAMGSTTLGDSTGSIYTQGIVGRVPLPRLADHVTEVVLAHGPQGATVEWAMDDRHGRRELLLFVGLQDFGPPLLPGEVEVVVRFSRT
jgi:hypothetical protein